MKILEIVKGDDIYLELVSSDKDYTTWTFKDTTVDDLIEVVNYINKNTYENLDVSLLNKVTNRILRVFNNDTQKTIAEYEILPNIENSIMEYCWDKIKF